jgi:hypothetical protein
MRTVIVAVTVIVASSAALAEPLPVPKTGTCPSGFRESGGFCAPMTRDAPMAVPKPKGQQCPSGFAQSGGARLETPPLATTTAVGALFRVDLPMTCPAPCSGQVASP